MVPSRLYAQPGQKILPKLNQLVRWLRGQKVRPGDERVTVSETPTGTIVTYADKPRAIPFPLMVRLASPTGFYITEGYVNGASPVFYSELAGKYLRCDLEMSAQHTAKIPPHRSDEDVLFLIVVRVKAKDFTSSDFLVFHASVEAFNRSMLLNQGVALQELRIGIPYRNTGKGDAAKANMEFYIPLAILRYGVVHQYAKHNLYFKVYYDAERKRMVYWAG